MSLTAKDVAEITRLLEESAFDELDLEIDGVKLHLRRGTAGDAPSPPPLGERASCPSPAARSARPNPLPADLSRARERGEECGEPANREQPRTHAQQAESDPSLHEVAAPLLGTFYRAPKPGAPPFVDTGSTVEEDSIVGIIEVMKLMNAVRAGVRGTVERILAQDGALVEYGETLLCVRRS